MATSFVVVNKVGLKCLSHLLHLYNLNVLLCTVHFFRAIISGSLYGVYIWPSDIINTIIEWTPAIWNMIGISTQYRIVVCQCDSCFVSTRLINHCASTASLVRINFIALVLFMLIQILEFLLLLIPTVHMLPCR